MEAEEKLFEKAYAECEATDINQVDVDRFIKQCERSYAMTTAEFRQWYEQTGWEGNVEQQMWYQFSANGSEN